VNKAILLFGPTAVGKTETIQSLFGPQTGRLFEIISTDSLQVYRGCDIGTAKPSLFERESIPHHLIDVNDPDDPFHLGDFVQQAREIAADIESRGAIPVLSGGTAYYFKHFLYGLPEAPPADPRIRSRLQQELDELGNEALHQRLGELDPDSAQRIHVNDSYRIVRALEIVEASGKAVGSFKRESETAFCPALILGLMREKSELHARIEKRVYQMMQQGLYQELEGLVAKGCSSETAAMKAIGYREFFKEGELRVESELDEIEAEIIQNTKKYAKRQMTFFRSLNGVQWYHPDKVDELARQIKLFLDS
jgi:tRNA dimethylallyltransferase